MMGTIHFREVKHQWMEKNGSMDTIVIEEDLNYFINCHCNDMQESSASYQDHTWEIHEDHSRRTQGRHFTLPYLGNGNHNIRCEVAKTETSHLVNCFFSFRKKLKGHK